MNEKEKLVRIKSIELKELEELEPLLVKNPDLIEEGMKVLARQLQTDIGRLDILAVDSEGALVIIELKDEIDDEQLNQGIRYYDWAVRNLAWLASVYKNVDPKKSPRLILIAPGFSENLKIIAKYTILNSEDLLELKEYHAFELPNGQRAIYFSSLEIGEIPERPEIPTIEDKEQYIESEEVKQLFRKSIEILKENGIEVKPIHGRRISLWYKEKRFAYIATRRNWFLCKVEKLDGSWTELFRITNQEEWNKVFQEYILPAIRAIEQK
ncbi:MAG: endonuclease NucS [Candidatus Aenigmatarchaeota archaeon]